MTGKVLVLGASGRFGGTMAEAFWNAGWHVSLFDRKVDDLAQAAQGMDVIVNGYCGRTAHLRPLTDQIITACYESGARLLCATHFCRDAATGPSAIHPLLPDRVRPLATLIHPDGPDRPRPADAGQRPTRAV